MGAYAAFPKWSRYLLVLILPFLIFLFTLDFYGFDHSFYQKKFLEYNVYGSVPEADSLHEEVINFIKGKSYVLPDKFNARESLHLQDIRSMAGALEMLLLILIFLAVLLLAVSALALKSGRDMMNFSGEVLLLGGILTVALAVLLFFLVSYGFSAAFDLLHTVFFREGTYTFDPSNEIIVRLYPEQLFMDLAAGMSKAVLLNSAVIAVLGAFLILKAKRKRIKTEENKNAR